MVSAGKPASATVGTSGIADARAVFVTLREAVGDEEFFDIEAQLSDDYAPLLGLR